MESCRHRSVGCDVEETEEQSGGSEYHGQAMTGNGTGILVVPHRFDPAGRKHIKSPAASPISDIADSMTDLIALANYKVKAQEFSLLIQNFACSIFNALKDSESLLR